MYISINCKLCATRAPAASEPGWHGLPARLVYGGSLALIVSQETQRVAVQVCLSLLLPGFPIAITKLCTVIRNNFILPIQTIVWEVNPCLAGIMRALTRCPPSFSQLLPAISSNTVKMLIG
jgi:hypothetical protein